MKKLLSLILASLILSMSAATVFADEAAEAAPETPAAESETTTPEAEAEIMLISEEIETEEETEAETTPAELKILTDGEEGYAAAKAEGQAPVEIITVSNDQNIDARRLLDHNANTGISYTNSPEANPILNLAFELAEPTVVTSFAFSCAVDTAGAVTAFLYATNDIENGEWTYLKTEKTEAGDGYYTYNSVEKFVREFKYYRLMLVFTPVDEETNEVDTSLPAEFYLSEVELFEKAPEKEMEVKNNLPSFPLFNRKLTRMY